MGNSTSQAELESVGYRVLGVQPNSPASNGGLVSFFDFIVEANSKPLVEVDGTFIELIKESEDKELPLTIYNIKNHSRRKVLLTPSKKWPGEGMLGVTIRFDSYYKAEENLLHVLEIEPNSPAELAGLIPYKDYLLGTAEKAFKNTEILYDELVEHEESPVEFYVYNSDTDNVRTVLLMPSRQWGGEGLLGASVASGYLHVLPSRCCTTIGSSNDGSIKGVQSPFGPNNTEEQQDGIATIADSENS